MQQRNIETFEQKAPEILADLAKHIEAGLMARVAANDDWNINKAKQISVDVAHEIANAWGGEVIYIPRNVALLLSERDHKIWQEFNGFNHRELSRKYSVSMVWVYQIVKRMRKAEIARNQFDMFANE
ncbi:transcriptional regulator [Canicola haemoglobinophilus]|uniref:Bacteriophage transcriptional regulator n=1 Tax=Canicola haemoglobinophilus TaxID=733 RepID=A0A1V4AYR6_9PAST|nr:Mor transcription activator family protein [Canicola haemoglobinophilus]OOR97172.1 transcriptional regulator [Canicola haemoglobinophilus]STO55155.1 bacteriophage transcriptional regulator [Canicola haemoglobinophilus]STO59186.1 bacteriophage transcriptional regulator [Canicola haemoglobinophilus]STO69274.1 bacteriophage transcriptional regulator [Canicola haemoglobinophilus]